MSIKRFRQRIIQRWHGEIGDLFRVIPCDGFRFLRLRRALPAAASVKKNYKRALIAAATVGRGSGVTAGKADRLQRFRQNAQGQLFLELARRSVLGSLPRFDLSPRKFPEAAMHRSEMPLLHENFFVLIDKGDGSNEQGCQNFFQFRSSC